MLPYSTSMKTCNTSKHQYHGILFTYSTNDLTNCTMHEMPLMKCNVK